MIAGRRGALAAWIVGAALALVACSGDPPPAGQLDGNFIIGDATPAPDGAPRDARADTDARDDTDGSTDTDGSAAHQDAAPGRDVVGVDAALSLDGEVGLDAAPPDPCVRTTTVMVSARELLARAAALDGQVVEVVATATVSSVACTRRACPPESPCCNSCSADVVLDDVVPLTAGACAPRAGCMGDECNLVCSPPVLGFPQTFRGVVRASPRPSLELMRVLP